MVIESLIVEDDGDGDVLIIGVRADKGAVCRCGRCGLRAPWYDPGGGVRRWRHLDFGVVRVLIEAAAPRVDCPRRGPTVVQAPWTRQSSRFTTAFEDTCAWLAARTAAATVGDLLRVSWRSVTGIAARVVTEAGVGRDLLARLRRLGIDEVAYRKGQRYLTVVVYHDTSRLVWAKAGRDKATVAAFVDDLGPRRAAQLTYVSADAAERKDA